MVFAAEHLTRHAILSKNTAASVIRKQFLIHFSAPINAHLIITVPEVNYCRVVRKRGRVCLQRHRLALLCETACVCGHGRTNSNRQNYHKCCCEKAAHVDLHIEQRKTKRPSFLMELFSNHPSRKSAAIWGVGSAVMRYDKGIPTSLSARRVTCDVSRMRKKCLASCGTYSGQADRRTFAQMITRGTSSLFKEMQLQKPSSSV